MWFIRAFYGFHSVSRSTYISLPLSNIASDLDTGEYCYIGKGAYICQRVTFGNYVMLGPDVSVLGGDHRFDKIAMPVIFSGRPETPKTLVEDDVWIGNRAIIMAGITIGRGAIVAAGAVVTKDVAPYTIVAGTPANFLKMRFESEEATLQHDIMLRSKPSLMSYAEHRD